MSGGVFELLSHYGGAVPVGKDGSIIDLFPE
eukprot:CAMPEP_0182931054 /NCGR_PEP_ID=MMETSP0105_2-20130417/27284_1 /TAXON_ID=81532 ORGANISM="Acanthoeca-like sp., Strain 10tr" /NCGR_SAMPLE_ID=MMETSP0105_2 /ASSEMBLY_ACC=CAM_ASM_000205 /LENGTH=30 /DNA_ID= /DNA_START= /DNA_END= /DNA_ORIENTATION=